MDDIYAFSGWCESGFTPKERVYGIAELRARQPLTEFDSWASGFLLKRKNSERFEFVKFRAPSVITLDNEKRPVYESKLLDDIDELLLVSKMENHCMTFYFKEDKQFDRVEMMDAFYNDAFNDQYAQNPQQQSPYPFGPGNFFSIASLSKYGGLLDVGTMEVVDAQGKSKQVPLFLQLLNYSTRAECAAMSESGEHIKYCSTEIHNVDVTKVLNEQKDQRDLLLSRLREWYQQTQS
mmetsp:Transcript_294/g.348  ORF Transcript_294/g.348 Transcript_294/m.348 type:complete len:236 (+) Transcript_294:242-949(+)